MENVESPGNLLLPSEIYSLYLESINGIYFTRRETDIIACISSGRSTKKIASFLSISTRTVENHIRNIMLKLGCRTQEGIIDFIEKSSKFTAVKQYYASLLIQDSFEKCLKKISAAIPVNTNALTCLLIHNKEEKKGTLVINQLKSHLEMVGFLTRVDNPLKYPAEASDFTNRIPFSKANYIINYLDKSDPQQVQPSIDRYKPEKSSAFNYVEFNSKENYYFTILSVLATFLPNVPLYEEMVLDFKKEYQAFYEPFSTIEPKISIQKKSPTEDKKKLQSFKIFKNKKRWGLTASTLCFIPLLTWFLTYNFQAQNRHLNGTAKSYKVSVVGDNNLSNSGSHLQSNPLSVASWNLPPQHHQFIGREKLLQAIHNAFHPNIQSPIFEDTKNEINRLTPFCISVLAGLGGVGKTQLALEYIHHPKYSYKLKAWFSAESIDQLKQQYIEFARFLGYKEQKLQINRALTYIKEVLMSRPNWILVYDNVNNYEELKEYLPEGNGNIIITTRQRNWPSTFQIMNIDVMSETESIQLLTSLTKNEISQREMVNAKELVKTLGYLPLALAQAGSYIQQNSILIQEYLELYKQHESDLLLDTAAPEGTNSLPVGVTRNITLDAIIKDPYIDEKHSTLALHLLNACGYLASEEIPRNLLLSWLRRAHPELISPELILPKLIGKLWQYSMISKNQNGDITIHPLVQTVLRHQHKQTLIKKNSYYPKLTLAWYDALLKSIHTEFHRSTKPSEDEARKRALYPHLQWLLKNYELIWGRDSTKSHIGDVICDIGDIIFEQMFNTKLAKSYYERGLPLQKLLYGESHPRVAYTLRNLGTVYRKLGDYEKARELFEQALEIQEHHYGKDHPSVATILTTLGFAHRLFGDFEQANNFLNRALLIQEAHYGKNHPEVAIILECLGIVDYKMEYYDEAKSKFERALKILESHYNVDHPTIGYVLRNLGHTYAISGDPKTAISLLERSLKNQRRYCNENSPEIAFTLRDLGLAYGLYGYYKQGIDSLEHALRVQEDTYGKNHPEVAFTLNYLGTVYAKQNDYNKAKALLNQAILIQEKFYGKEHPETQKTLKTLENISSKPL